ncbi:unnamed protein product [Orchesella dallaii]|uniref:Gustatory receptor n=1 Tax=Orchesella dallaii TaxID=48710 RepID=A0ABP1Q2S1_9HEXA
MTFNSKSTTVETKLLNSTNWALFQPRLICYWPFLIYESNQGLKQVHFRYLWNIRILISLIFLLCGILYLVYCGKINAEAYLQNDSLLAFDVYCVVIWEIILITSEISIRIYGLLNSNKFVQFWGNIVELVGTYFELSSSHPEVENGLEQINKWAKRWTLFTSTLISFHLGCFIYPYIFQSDIRKDEDLFQALMNIYMEVAVCSVAPNVMFLIYFVKILILGFDVISKNIQEMTKLHIDREKVKLVFSKANNPKQNLNTCFLSEINQEEWVNIEWSGKLNIINRLDKSVERFNAQFGIPLLGVVITTMAQVIFALYFCYADPRMGEFTWAVSLISPLILCPFTLVALCFSASELGEKCDGVLRQLQEIPANCLNQGDQWLPLDAFLTLTTDGMVLQVQLIVTRLSAKGMGVYVGRLFQIRAALLTSAVSTFATYFIIIIQMRIGSQSAKLNHSH